METSPEIIAEAASILRRGGTVVMPTETVYGLAANALDPKAVARIFEIKDRPRFNPLIVHVPDTTAAEPLTSAFPPEARRLAEKFWPGPLTLVLPKAASVPDIVTAGLPTVALRVPNHPVAQALLRAAGVPLAAPSANLFSTLSPTRLSHALDGLEGKTDFFLDGGPCEVGLESTIVGFIDGKTVLLRPGGIPRESIEEITGPLADLEASEKPLAPGGLARHYAPRTKLLLWDGKTPPPAGKATGLLCVTPPRRAQNFEVVEALSPTGDLREAASRLFERLRALDALNLDLLFASPGPDSGLGIAINDRLKRAASGNFPA